MTNFDATQRQLVEHKEQMAGMEQLFQDQQQDFKTKLDEASQQLQEYRARLQQSNRLQVKQYKKQVDGLKAAVETQVTAKQEVCLL